jgi:hypothetical protein
MNKTYILYLIVFVFLITIIATISEPNSFIDRLFDKFRASIVIYVIIGIYLTYYILEVNIDETRRNNTLKIIDKGFLNIVRIIQHNYNKCPKFCSSMFFDWQKDKLVKNYRELNNEDDWTTVLLLSIEIFQSWENVLTVRSVDETSMYVWFCNFIQCAKSEELYKAWQVLYPNYADRTIRFGNLLFAEVRKNIPKNSKQLEKLGIKLYNNKIMKSIISK